jgi:hypothetical protein
MGRERRHPAIRGPRITGVRVRTAEVVPAGTRNALNRGVNNLGRKKLYIDVVQNVFGGVRISTEDEVRGGTSESDIGARPWLAGLTVSAADVRLLDDEEPKKPPR